MSPVSTINPVKRQVLSETVAETLRVLILAGELSPGEKLPAEQSLAEQFGVSRNVIREALRRLNEQGLAEVRHGAGIFVSAPDQETVVSAFARYVHLHYGKEQVASIYEARALLEPQIAALAAERATLEDIAALDETYERMQRNTGEPEAWSQADLDFHLVMADATHNPILPLLLRSLTETLREMFEAAWNQEEGRRAGLEYHGRVLQDVKARDGAAARRTVEEQLSVSRVIVERAVAQTDTVVGREMSTEA